MAAVPAISVIFEDEHLVVVDKPAGLPVTRAGAAEGAARRQAGTTLMEQVQAGRSETVINTHRIDAEVSGLVICAKQKPAADFLSGQFQSKTAERVYVGFAVLAQSEEELARISEFPPVRGAGGGWPERFDIDYGLGPDLHVAGRMHVYRKRGGRPALSRVRVVETFGRFAWIEGRPETSREKQLQAHLAAVGAPVLGDDAHGLPEVKLMLSSFKRGYKGRENEKPLVDRVALHLATLTVKHPESKQPVTFTADLPKDLDIALRNLRKFARR